MENGLQPMSCADIAGMVLEELECRGLSTTHYRAARELNVTQTTFSRWLSGEHTIGAKHAYNVATYLSLDSFYLDLLIEVDLRKGSEGYLFWFNILKNIPFRR